MTASPPPSESDAAPFPAGSVAAATARTAAATTARTAARATARTPAATEATAAPDGPRRRIRRSGATRASGERSGPYVLDRYRLVRRLGTGAFGTVWQAHDEHLGRDVAVKVLAPERVRGGRFEREALAAARLAHPGIVTLYEAAADEEGAYLVSQLVDGETLDALGAEGQLSDRDLVAIGIALCDALSHAHAQGIVHRDVKPSNVLIPDAPASAGEIAKLTDFGVARVLGAAQLTLTGDVVGTLAYMAPEQADGREVGPAADLYALALVLYEGLTGVNPVLPGSGLRAQRRLAVHLPPLRRQRRDLPRVLGQAIDRALRPRPAERGTVEELRWALVQARDEVGDEPGVVGDPWSPLGAMTAIVDAPADDRRGPLDGEGRADSPVSGAEQSGRPLRIPWPQRALGAAGAAAIAAWLTTIPHAPVTTPAPAALAAGGVVVVLPRIGWLGLIVAAALAALVAGLPGLAVLLAGGLLLAWVLLPGAPGLWGAGAGAPALGLLAVAGLAGAWPALAGRARRPWRRAGLAALGWFWLLLAGAIAGRGLIGGRLAGAPSPRGLESSIATAWSGLLVPEIRAGVWAGAIVWGLAAAVVPWLLAASRSRLSRSLWALAWSVAVAVAPGLAIGLAGGSRRWPGPSGVPVAILASLLVLLGWPLLIDGLQRRVRGSEDPRLP